MEFLRDLLGLPVSIGTVHQVVRSATRQAGVINHDQDLSGIRVGLHDEIFQGATPVLAGVDARSTYCYLLAAEERRDADTWGVPLLDAAQQALRPDYTTADAGQGLRAGQRAAWGDTPCHGDVFHIQRQCEGLANTLSHLAKGATSRRQTLQASTGRAGQRGPDDERATQLALARQAEAQAHELARDIRTLIQWLRHDVLALAGPALASRRRLFDFLVEELARREPGDARRIRPVQVALQNQRDTLLAFAGVLDDTLANIAQTHAIAEPLVRKACLLQRLPSISSAYWQGWNRPQATMDGKFHVLLDAVSHAMTHTPRSSSLSQERPEPSDMTSAQRRPWAGWRRRAEVYESVMSRHRAGASIMQISRDLALARNTVRHWLRGEQPDSCRPRVHSLDPWRALLERRWAEGCRNGARLWREARDAGFAGGLDARQGHSRQAQPNGTANRPAERVDAVAGPELPQYAWHRGP